MNLKVLPPKRFQDPGHHYFDPIRHERWYGKLMKRRVKIVLLSQAAIVWDDGLSQKAAADLYGVDARELRDYIIWVKKTPRRAVSVAEQAILDGAYEMYCNPKNDNQPFGWFIRHVASLFGVPGRPIEELWETHHGFYPQCYPIPNL